MTTEELAVHEVSRAAALGHFLCRLRQGEGELVEIGHRRHSNSFPKLVAVYKLG